MGDIPTLANAKRELEELYSGVPDDSVNLTFQDLAELRQQNAHSEKKKAPHMDPIAEANPRKEEVAPLTKLPSLDFNRAFEATGRSDHPSHYRNHHLPHIHPLSHTNHFTDQSSSVNHLHHGVLDHHGAAGLHGHHANAHGHHHGMDPHASPFSHRGHDHHAAGGFRHGMDSSMAYDDMSGMSMASKSGLPAIGGSRRPGIPHSNICTVCSTYIYIFRHRCLVCGRVYCRQCVSIGMGEMSEGRKCIECLGRRFSQRYIQRAGQLGCCMGYPSITKQQELKWAEKGPRRSGEDRYGRSGMVPRSRSPAPRTPTRPHTPNNNSNSFVMSSPYSPYTTNHPLPF